MVASLTLKRCCCFLAIPCTVDVLDEPVNGMASAQPGQTINIGQNVTYTCNENFHILGSNASSLSLICEVGGIWSTDIPTCVCK